MHFETNCKICYPHRFVDFYFILFLFHIVGSQIVAQTQIEKDMGPISPVQ